MLLPIIETQLQKVLKSFGLAKKSLEWLLSNVVVPTIDCGRYVVDCNIVETTAAGTGVLHVSIPGGTVPAGKVWTLTHVFKGASVGLCGVKIMNNIDNSRMTIIAPVVAADMFIGRLPMKAGWVLQLKGGGNAADTGIVVEFCYEEQADGLIPT